MSVYLDQSRNRYGPMIMCHMIADTPEELRAIANKIGVSLRWFQKDSSTPHFDICLSKRKLAIRAGAAVLDRRDYVMAMRRIRQTWPKENGQWTL